MTRAARQLQPEHGYVEVESLRLHYLDWGNHGGQPLVLLHGLQDCARSWDFFAAGMRSDYHVIALDHRGHGDSDRAQALGYRPPDYVADVQGLFNGIGLQSAVLLGHAAGGRSAMVFSVLQPEVVESLVVVDTDPSPTNAEQDGMLRQYRSDRDEYGSMAAVVEHIRSRQPGSTDEMIAHQAEHMTRELLGGRRTWKRDRTVLDSNERPNLWAEWEGLRRPVLVVRGRQSTFLTHEVAVRMREAVPRVRLAELEGGGHWFYQEFPGAFEAAVRWFLESPP